MATLRFPADLFDALDRHLRARPEQVGFCLGEWDAQSRAFDIREWRAVSAEGLSAQTQVHLALADEERAEIIRWAWDSGLSLIEAHSHGALGQAAFSASDLWGFSQWVPHVWWRLQTRPYAAIVTAGEDFDALAWIDAADAPEQVRSLLIGESRRVASGWTLAGPPTEIRRGRRDG